MKLKKYILFFFLILFSFGCGKKEDEVIKIGAVLPLSGDNAKYGKWIKEGLDLKLHEINNKSGINGKRIKIVYEDDQAKPQIAVSAIEKLINNDKVKIVFGSWASSCALAMAPIAEKNQVILMAIAITPKLRDAGDYIFRIQPDARYYISKLVPFIYDSLNLRTISIMNINNDFGIDQRDVFKDLFEKMGGKIIRTEEYLSGTTDFRAQLLNIKRSKPDALFLPGYIEVGIILKQAKELGLNCKFLSSVPFENEDVIKTAGNAAEGIIYPYHFNLDFNDSLSIQFQENYKKKYGHYAEGFAALAYDGLGVLESILIKCRENTNCIKENLYKSKNYYGITGLTNFDNHGDIIKTIFIKTVHNGSFVNYE